MRATWVDLHESRASGDHDVLDIRQRLELCAPHQYRRLLPHAIIVVPELDMCGRSFWREGLVEIWERVWRKLTRMNSMRRCHYRCHLEPRAELEPGVRERESRGWWLLKLLIARISV